MTLRQTCDVTLRVSRSESVTLVFCPTFGAEPLRDKDGSPLFFSIPLEQDDAGLAAMVKNLARWIAELAVKQIQEEAAAVREATATTPATAPAAEPPRRKKE